MKQDALFHLLVFYHLVCLSFSQIISEGTGGKHKAHGAESGPPPCFIWPGTLFLPGNSAELLAPSSGAVPCTQSRNHMQPFEGNCKGDVAPGDNESDTAELKGCV